MFIAFFPLGCGPTKIPCRRRKIDYEENARHTVLVATKDNELVGGIKDRSSSI
jgi:hypothetical protein